MSEEDDLENIPVLDDIVVAGDLDKAVTDANDLTSIESFDDLFDANDNEDDGTGIEAENNPAEPDTTANTFNTLDNEALNDDLFESTQDEVINTESVEDNNPPNDKPIESMDDYNALVGTNDAAESNIDMQEMAPDESIDELIDETELVNPPIDLNQLVENVIHDIMPTLETQIKALVLTSLEKHLSEPTGSTNDETDLNTNEDL